MQRSGGSSRASGISSAERTSRGSRTISCGTSRASNERWTSSASFIRGRLSGGKRGEEYAERAATTRPLRWLTSSPRGTWLVGCPPVPAQTDKARAARRAVRELLRVAPTTDPLAERFNSAGHALHLVGGPVRDALLDRLHEDLDFAT